MVATAQRYTELHPNVEVVWEKRSLQAFADRPVKELAACYDLLVIDHPWTGYAAATGALLPLDGLLPDAFLRDQAENSVGKSFMSYTFDGYQWALPIDAATPVAASRPDLLKARGLALPQTFDDVLALADRGLVGLSLLPIDALMSFYMFCSTLGKPACQTNSEVVAESCGIIALKIFKSLVDRVDLAFFSKNPIGVYETMANSDTIAYCPFAYGYSNYSRNGYGRHLLLFHDLVDLASHGPLISTLGGAGLAISARCAYPEVAVDYARFVASPGIQETLYADAGGQPGHRCAWTSDYTNGRTSNYFTNTLPALERAYLRPRYAGHLYFQDHAGDLIVNYLQHGGNERKVLESLNQLYHQSLLQEAHG